MKCTAEHERVAKEKERILGILLGAFYGGKASELVLSWRSLVWLRSCLFLGRLVVIPCASFFFLHSGFAYIFCTISIAYLSIVKKKYDCFLGKSTEHRLLLVLWFDGENVKFDPATKLLKRVALAVSNANDLFAHSHGSTTVRRGIQNRLISPIRSNLDNVSSRRVAWRCTRRLYRRPDLF